MGIRVLPTDPATLLKMYKKDHAKWKRSEPKRSGYNLKSIGRKKGGKVISSKMTGNQIVASGYD